VILILTALIIYNNLYITFLAKGIGLFGGLFYTKYNNSIIQIFIIFLSIIILNLTAFYTSKVWTEKYRSMYGFIFRKLIYYRTNIWDKMNELLPVNIKSCVIIILLLETLSLLAVFLVLNTYINDAPKVWGLYFQDRASSQMEAIIELHNNIIYFLAVILFGIGWILIYVVIVKTYTKQKSPISNKYQNHGTLIELIWTITPALILILIAFPSFKLLFLIDDVADTHISLGVESDPLNWSYQYDDFTKNEDGSLIEFDSYLVPESDLEKAAFYKKYLQKNNFYIPLESKFNNFFIPLEYKPLNLVSGKSAPEINIAYSKTNILMNIYKSDQNLKLRVDLLVKYHDVLQDTILKVNEEINIHARQIQGYYLEILNSLQAHPQNLVGSINNANMNWTNAYNTAEQIISTVYPRNSTGYLCKMKVTQLELNYIRCRELLNALGINTYDDNRLDDLNQILSELNGLHPTYQANLNKYDGLCVKYVNYVKIFKYKETLIKTERLNVLMGNNTLVDGIRYRSINLKYSTLNSMGLGFAQHFGFPGFKPITFHTYTLLSAQKIIR